MDIYKVDLLFCEGHLVYECILDWCAGAVLSRAHNTVYLIFVVAPCIDSIKYFICPTNLHILL